MPSVGVAPLAQLFSHPATPPSCLAASLLLWEGDSPEWWAWIAACGRRTLACAAYARRAPQPATHQHPITSSLPDLSFTPPSPSHCSQANRVREVFHQRPWS